MEHKYTLNSHATVIFWANLDVKLITQSILRGRKLPKNKTKQKPLNLAILRKINLDSHGRRKGSEFHDDT